MANRQRAISMSDETYSKTVTMLINKYFEAHAAEIESFEAAEVRSDRN